MTNSSIYTVITGCYDKLRQPIDVLPGIDYICFSSTIREKNIGIWEIRPIPYENKSAIRLSRYPKLLPHKVLPEYDNSLYVDANIQITTELNTAMKVAIESGADCAMVKHPERQCTYDEALLLAMLHLGEPFKIVRQMVKLLREGLPPKYGLFACSILFRKHNSPRVIAFSDSWWEDYSRYAYRDQLSVMGALRRVGISPAELIDSSFIPNNTIPHTFAPPREKKGLVWHGVRFTRRKSAELLLRLLYAMHGFSSDVKNPYRKQ